MKALQEFLRPEFINRVDEIVYFHQLTEENFAGIARIMLRELTESLSAKGFTFTYDDTLVAYLVDKSYSAAYGARNLRRCIQKELEDPMAVRIIESFDHPITHIRGLRFGRKGDPGDAVRRSYAVSQENRSPLRLLRQGHPPQR